MGGFRGFGVVPAAGRSARMGTPKLLLPWGRSTIIEQVLAAWRASRVAGVVVVVHPDDVELAARCRAAGAEVVATAPPPPHMKDSVARGLARVEERWSPQAGDAWLLAPADIPGLTPERIDRLLAAHQPQRPTIVVPSAGGRRSHPVLFPWPTAEEVGRLPDNLGVNELLRRHPVVELPIAEKDLDGDVDTPEDYRRLYERSHPPT
jgi:molybdenum cofactor cytidylyltransferase